MNQDISFAENSNKTAKILRGKPFEKGVSGNAGGRPKELHGLREKARERTDEALEVLTSIMHNQYDPASSRIAAACAILDRGYGKPTQHLKQDLQTHAVDAGLQTNLENFLRFLSHEERASIMMLYRRYKDEETKHVGCINQD